MPRQASRKLEERVSYAVGHRIRIEVLVALNERTYSTIDLARIVRQPLSTVTHHVEELLKDGSIEIADSVKVRSITQNIYRAVKPAYFTDEEMAALPFEERQEIYGVILQAAMAEAMASLWAGNISSDPRAVLAWRWFNLDPEGRREMADEMAESWERAQGIEARSMNRVAQSGEATTSVIVTSLSYERSRNTPHPPLD